MDGGAAGNQRRRKPAVGPFSGADPETGWGTCGFRLSDQERDAVNFLERQLEDPVRLAWLKRWFYIGLAAIALAEVVLPIIFYLLKRLCEALGRPGLAELFDVHPPHFWFEGIPAWGSLYGLASCVAIIIVSKFLGKVWLMRGEDYYDS
jgi:hypothetical protein